MLNLIDKRIRQAFSNAAMQYDVLTNLHKEIGRELVAKIQGIDHDGVVLDVGMGTGELTKRLKKFFPDALVVGCDFASGMISQAKEKQEDFQIVQADAIALPFKLDVFDMITSNLALQWVNNLNSSFQMYHARLKKEGQFCFTMFGHETLKELFVALEHAADGKQNKRDLFVRRLAKIQQVQEAMQMAGFKDIHVSAEHIKVRFPDMMAVMQWLKSIGANTLGKDIFLGKEMLARAKTYYHQNFSDRLGIYATFEVIWGQGKK